MLWISSVLVLGRFFSWRKYQVGHYTFHSCVRCHMFQHFCSGYFLLLFFAFPLQRKEWWDSDIIWKCSRQSLGGSGFLNPLLLHNRNKNEMSDRWQNMNQEEFWGGRAGFATLFQTLFGEQTESLFHLFNLPGEAISCQVNCIKVISPETRQ